MKFTTEVEIASTNFTLSYDMQGVVVGSCFAQNIGKRLADNKFNVVINPCGSAYNPISVKRTLALVCGKERFSKDDIIPCGDIFISFDHSTEFSAATAEQTYNNIIESLELAAEKFNESSYLIITLGTAWVYKLGKKITGIAGGKDIYFDGKTGSLREGKIVNNCHKLPAFDFERGILSTETITKELQEMLNWDEFANKKVIFTVSPVRHIKDGLHGNQVSKATLLLAVDNIVKNNANALYFPAYEILMDELRDYRYYADDMLHPSDLAVEYIWQRFADWAIDTDSQNIMRRITKINAALNHRPFRKDSDEYKRFMLKTQHDIDELLKEFPKMNFSR